MLAAKVKNGIFSGCITCFGAMASGEEVWLDVHSGARWHVHCDDPTEEQLGLWHVSLFIAEKVQRKLDALPDLQVGW